MGRQKGDQPLGKKDKKAASEERKPTKVVKAAMGGTELLAEGNESFRGSDISNRDAAGGAPTDSTPVKHFGELGKHQNRKSSVDSAGDHSPLPQTTDSLSSPVDSLTPPAETLHLPRAETLHLPPVEDRATVFSEVSRSIVTVASVQSVGGDIDCTEFGTGFILLAEKNYVVIFTSLSAMKQVEFVVYLEGGNVKAHVAKLAEDKKFCLIIAETSKQYPSVIFSDTEPYYEPVFVVGAMAGTRLRANEAVIHSLIGDLGIYRGAVTTPTCSALGRNRERVSGSDQYFQLSCSIHDKITVLEEVDNTDHTSHIIEAAPVFRPNGKSVGLIYSSGVWRDTKTGLLAKYVYVRIANMIKCKNTADWEEKLKELADAWFADSQNIQPTDT